MNKLFMYILDTFIELMRPRDWRNDFLLNKKLDVFYGQSRPNVWMNGVYSSENIKKGEFLVGWSHYFVKYDPNINYINSDAVAKYAMNKELNNHKFAGTPRFDINGKPILPKYAEELIDTSLAIFMNEPSPNIVSYIDKNSIVKYSKVKKNEPNACFVNYWNTIVSIALRNISKNEEITHCYGKEYPRDYSVPKICDYILDICDQIFEEHIFKDPKNINLIFHKPIVIDKPQRDSFLIK